MKCQYCNSFNVDNALFCTECGKPLSKPQPEPESRIPDASVPDIIKPSAGPKKGYIVAICILAAVVVICITVVIALLITGSGSKAPETDTQQSQTVTEETLSEKVNEAEKFDRYSTYYVGYTYKNMPEIHYTIESSNETSLELEKFIFTYNQAWLNFINENDASIYAYLRTGTKAYDYTLQYAHKNITEEFKLIDVKDVREYDGTYYVWVHEIITETSADGSSKDLEYHWIYKTGMDVNGYYVENYTADPHYN